MIIIQVTPLSYRIKMSSNGQLLGTNHFITKYVKRFEHTKWDNRVRRSILYRRYVHYDAKTSTLFLPHYDLMNFCAFLQTINVAYALEHLPLQNGMPVEIQLKSHIQDKNQDQTDAIEYLTTCPDSQRGLSSLPGFGKTYCAVKTIAHIGRRAMICVGGLVDQWKRAIMEYTTLTEDDIYVIQGAPSMTKLLLQIDQKIFPKVILCSLGTIRAYALADEAYENYPPFTEICDRLKIGIKVLDEAHLNFFLTLMVDLQTNAEVNIALTATFDRGDYQVKQIFDAHYPRLMRFGENNLKKYVDIYSYSYSLGGALPPKAYMTPNGYNHSKLEEYLIRRVPQKLKYIFDSTYKPAIYAHYVNVRKPGQRLLILCSTVIMCQWIKDRLVQDLPWEDNFKIAMYISDTDDSVLSQSDIIVSTPGSGGTGTDIKDLLTVFMTLATSSDNMNKQSLGRLRELPNGDTPVYAYAWCRDISKHVSYQETRRYTFTNRGLNFYEIVL